MNLKKFIVSTVLLFLLLSVLFIFLQSKTPIKEIKSIKKTKEKELINVQASTPLINEDYFIVDNNLMSIKKEIFLNDYRHIERIYLESKSNDVVDLIIEIPKALANDLNDVNIFVSDLNYEVIENDPKIRVSGKKGRILFKYKTKAKNFSSKDKVPTTSVTLPIYSDFALPATLSKSKEMEQKIFKYPDDFFLSKMNEVALPVSIKFPRVETLFILEKQGDYKPRIYFEGNLKNFCNKQKENCVIELLEFSDEFELRLKFNLNSIIKDKENALKLLEGKIVVEYEAPKALVDFKSFYKIPIKFYNNPCKTTSVSFKPAKNVLLETLECYREFRLTYFDQLDLSVFNAEQASQKFIAKNENVEETDLILALESVNKAITKNDFSLMNFCNLPKTEKELKDILKQKELQSNIAVDVSGEQEEEPINVLKDSCGPFENLNSFLDYFNYKKEINKLNDLIELSFKNSSHVLNELLSRKDLTSEEKNYFEFEKNFESKYDNAWKIQKLFEEDPSNKSFQDNLIKNYSELIELIKKKPDISKESLELLNSNNNNINSLKKEFKKNNLLYLIDKATNLLGNEIIFYNKEIEEIKSLWEKTNLIRVFEDVTGLSEQELSEIFSKKEFLSNQINALKELSSKVQSGTDLISFKEKNFNNISWNLEPNTLVNIPGTPYSILLDEFKFNENKFNGYSASFKVFKNNELLDCSPDLFEKRIIIDRPSKETYIKACHSDKDFKIFLKKAVEIVSRRKSKTFPDGSKLLISIMVPEISVLIKDKPVKMNSVVFDSVFNNPLINSELRRELILSKKNSLSAEEEAELAFSRAMYYYNQGMIFESIDDFVSASTFNNTVYGEKAKKKLNSFFNGLKGKIYWKNFKDLIYITADLKYYLIFAGAIKFVSFAGKSIISPVVKDIVSTSLAEGIDFSSSSVKSAASKTVNWIKKIRLGKASLSRVKAVNSFLLKTRANKIMTKFFGGFKNSLNNVFYYLNKPLFTKGRFDVVLKDLFKVRKFYKLKRMLPNSVDFISIKETPNYLLKEKFGEVTRIGNVNARILVEQDSINFLVKDKKLFNDFIIRFKTSDLSELRKFSRKLSELKSLLNYFKSRNVVSNELMENINVVDSLLARVFRLKNSALVKTQPNIVSNFDAVNTLNKFLVNESGSINLIENKAFNFFDEFFGSGRVLKRFLNDVSSYEGQSAKGVRDLLLSKRLEKFDSGLYNAAKTYAKNNEELLASLSKQVRYDSVVPYALTDVAFNHEVLKAISQGKKFQIISIVINDFKGINSRFKYFKTNEIINSVSDYIQKYFGKNVKNFVIGRPYGDTLRVLVLDSEEQPIKKAVNSLVKNISSDVENDLSYVKALNEKITLRAGISSPLKIDDTLLKTINSGELTEEQVSSILSEIANKKINESIYSEAFLQWKHYSDIGFVPGMSRHVKENLSKQELQNLLKKSNELKLSNNDFIKFYSDEVSSWVKSKAKDNPFIGNPFKKRAVFFDKLIKEDKKTINSFNNLIDGLKNKKLTYNKVDEIYNKMNEIKEAVNKWSNILYVDVFGFPKSQHLFEGLIAKYLKEDKDIVIGRIDLDFFRQINQLFGFDVGDDLIKNAMGKVEQEILANNGVLVRLSGDEFGFILPETSSFNEIQGIIKNIQEDYLRKSNSILSKANEELFEKFSFGSSVSQGIIRKASMSVGIIRSKEFPLIKSPFQLNELASNALDFVKANEKGAFMKFSESEFPEVAKLSSSSYDFSINKFNETFNNAVENQYLRSEFKSIWLNNPEIYEEMPKKLVDKYEELSFKYFNGNLSKQSFFKELKSFAEKENIKLSDREVWGFVRELEEIRIPSITQDKAVQAIGDDVFKYFDVETGFIKDAVDPFGSFNGFQKVLKEKINKNSFLSKTKNVIENKEGKNSFNDLFQLSKDLKKKRFTYTAKSFSKENCHVLGCYLPKNKKITYKIIKPDELKKLTKEYGSYEKALEVKQKELINSTIPHEIGHYFQYEIIPKEKWLLWENYIKKTYPKLTEGKEFFSRLKSSGYYNNAFPGEIFANKFDLITNLFEKIPFDKSLPAFLTKTEINFFKDIGLLTDNDIRLIMSNARELGVTIIKDI